MSLLAELSGTLSRSGETVGPALMAALEALPARLRNDYLSSREKVQAGKTRLNSTMRWLLYHYSLQSGLLQCSLRYDDAALFAFGAEIIPWDSRQFETVTAGDERGTNTWVHIHRHLEQYGHRLDVDVVTPAGLERLTNNLLDLEFIPMAARYFFFKPDIQNERRIDHVEVLQSFARQALRGYLEQGTSVAISHFRFQDLRVYFEMSGDERTRDIMHAIVSTIRSNLKQRDMLFQLSPLSYVVVSPGAEREQIERRFKTIYFQVRSLVLEYRLTVVTVDRFPLRLNELWKDLDL